MIEVPTSVATPKAVICATSAACDALLPPDPPVIVRRFADEAWVAISLPAGYAAPKVTSDGTTASVSADHGCEATASRIVLYRVAKSVTKATIAAASTPCLLK